mmetsp:Transcript_19622/g.34111  ORF Transcript_19622/g.34111 Transcript_19622/m.34111 type:complete len:96 (+) Transcript_19622:343-630(+)
MCKPTQPPRDCATTSIAVTQQQASKATSFEFPRVFLIWCMIKTSIQLSLTLLSITFIVQSGYFVPYGYDATVWSREDLAALCVPQAIFEIVDLFF